MKVNWDDEITNRTKDGDSSQLNGKIKKVPNHQEVWKKTQNNLGNAVKLNMWDLTKQKLRKTESIVVNLD